MSVLAIDPGATSGWALSEPAFAGSVDHERHAMEDWWGDKPQRGMVTAWKERLDKDKRLKRTLGRYAGWLESSVRYSKPLVLIVERAAPFKGRSNTHVGEFRGVTMAVAARLDLAIAWCHPRQWQAFLEEPYDPAKDHDIAARLMLTWWGAQERAAA